MSDTGGKISCTLGCWLVALLGGILTMALLMVLGGWTFMQGLFAGLVVFLIAGLLLNWVLCKPLPAANSATHQSAHASSAATTTAAAATAGAAAASAASASDSAAKPIPAAEPEPIKAAESAPSGPTIKPSQALAGEAELAERKGSWKYEGDGGKAAKPAAKKAKKPKAAPAKTSAPAKDTTPDYDNDGVLEGENEGSKPVTLDGPRDGNADNLKEIKGIGPKLEKLCNSMGFYHFDQIAAWTPDEVAWVNANLEGFKGRVSRDKWVEQAGILASGGETEFSKRVEGGGVYD